MRDIRSAVITEIAAALDRLDEQNIPPQMVARVLGVETAALLVVTRDARCGCGKPGSHGMRCPASG